MLAIRYLTIVFVQVLPSRPAITPSSGLPSSVSSASDCQMLLHRSFTKPLGFMPGTGFQKPSLTAPVHWGTQSCMLGLLCYCLPCKACKCNCFYRALGWGPSSDSADRCVLQTKTLPTWLEEVLECRTATMRRSQGPTSCKIQLKWDVYCYNDQATHAGLLRTDADSMVLPRNFLEEQ